MNDFTMMHIFFTITSIFMGLLSILVLVILIFTYRIFKRIQKVADDAQDAGLKVTSALREVTGTVKNESQDVVTGVSRLIQKILPKK